MGVYIKGMEMPKNRGVFVYVGSDGTAIVQDDVVKITTTIEVPKHGRLIDADSLENEAQMRLLECNKYDNQFQKPYEVMRAIALAPTIIESEDTV